MIDILALIYMTAVSGLSLFGLLGLFTLALYWRHRHDTFPLPELNPADLPPVTVQLPIFNERYVVDRLIRAAVELDYPREKLQIQVLDDSTDDTTAKAAELVRRYRRQGCRIQLHHRTHRDGFKAGALAAALPQAQGEYIAIFDADFQPPPQFLRQTIPYFVKDPALGMVQARWDHLNAADSPLTAAQAIALDKHFAMEQTVRHRADLFPKFNGSGGVWRQACLVDAGGWHDDTVCEDLCLSTRAVLKGWGFQFLVNVTAPAELPANITAYKSQQARWAKGSFQCLRKYGRAILTDSRHTRTARLYALLSMSAYITQPLLLALLLVQTPLLGSGFRFPANMLLFSLAGLGQPLLFILAQQALHPDWKRRLRYFPALLLVAIGLAPSVTRALFQALVGRHHPFIRTPKRGGQRETAVYKPTRDWITAVELGFMLYALLGFILALKSGAWGPLSFLAACILGFGTVALLSLRDAFLP